MKKFKKSYLIIFIIIGVIYGLTSCTKHDQVLDENPVVPPSALEPGDTLWASKVSSGPNYQPVSGAPWNGNVDAVWNNAAAITEHVVVPDLGNNTFTGFVGNATDVKLRALYDANNIYFLAEWNCSNNPTVSSPWYFNPSTHLWAQMGAAPVWDANGVEVSPPFVQDQFVMMFNIANSCYGFRSQSCYAACHVNTSTLMLDTNTGNINSVPVFGGSMYTNGPNEKLDCWRARMLQVLNCNQANDTYIDWGNGKINANEVHNDPQLHSTDGGGNNKQSLTITGTITKENVPMWINVSGVYSNGAIMVSDTTNGTCVYVCAVDSNGILSYSATRGGAVIGIIDPGVGTNYQQIGTGSSMTLGSACVPGSIVGAYSGSRGDVTANAYWTGTGWRLMLVRALYTTDMYRQDVDFSSLADQQFGFGVMFNGADNEHAIKAGMLLSFKK